jgi:hypothetical protein
MPVALEYRYGGVLSCRQWNDPLFILINRRVEHGCVRLKTSDEDKGSGAGIITQECEHPWMRKRDAHLPESIVWGKENILGRPLCLSFRTNVDSRHLGCGHSRTITGGSRLCV